jgi:uncharacterized protein YjbI with pentapeptide repeats
MSGAHYYKGLTIEFDAAIPKLTIEGRRFEVVRAGGEDGPFVSGELPHARSGTLLRLAVEIIEQSLEFKKRDVIRQYHSAVLKCGVNEWNRWRRENPELRPILYDSDLTKEMMPSGLAEANFANTVLINCDFREQDLRRANFHEANLGRARLHDADLRGADFCRADLYQTELCRARLDGANLQGAQLAGTNFEGAKLINCKVYGISAWDLKLKSAEQRDLIIRYRHKTKDGQAEGEEGQITVEDLQVAQFIYLLLNNENIRTVIDTIGDKGVLILGRFTEGRKLVLDRIRERLRQRGFVPMLFDFTKPTQRDFTETIKTLAGLSRFIVADISNPKSSPLELQAIMPDYMIPFVPIIQDPEEPFSMFQDLNQKYGDWVLSLLRYDSVDRLLEVFDQAVIAEALKLGQKLLRRKAESINTRHVNDYLREAGPAPESPDRSPEGVVD